jgi:hypothetical protein
MAATPAEMREGIRATLAAAFEPDVQVSAYRLDLPQSACMQVIGSDEVEYDQALGRGLDNWTFQVQALAGSPISQVAQQLLDTWKHGAGATSVKTVLEANQTLSGKVQGLRVERASGDQIYSNQGAPEMLGCLFTVFVLNTGK